ncbi:MAG: aminotransferase class V-fold PLP-dependent enzyme [Gammaproteobacteria bacterium]|nr:aminotransferase class V-fold PLP-dependent enzyme [Gammaproteobacteria bacterium]
MSLEQLIGKEFQLSNDVIYLNHAAVAPWPTRTMQAVEDFARENATLGSKNYLQWLEHETELRTMLATLINAPSSYDIALLKSTSEALSVVAHGLEWQHGDNVVISDQEFPSNRIIWESLSRYGVNVIQVDLNTDTTPEQALINACDNKTRLLALSSVQFASGLRMDLSTLGQHCKQNKILFCLDAIQSIGAVEFDVQQYNADFVMADGHKWMLGPEGLALFYCRADLRDQIQLNQYGWHMIEHAHDFSRLEWQPSPTAQRFECGSPNMLGTHALRASLSLLLETGMETIEKYVLDNAKYLAAQVSKHNELELITDLSEGRYAGIVVFKHKTVDAETLYQYLMQQNVICAPRGGGIRFSPHFYTSKSDIDKAVQLAASYSV